MPCYKKYIRGTGNIIYPVPEEKMILGDIPENIGPVSKDLNIPEIKTRFTKGRKFYGKVNNSADIYDFLKKILGRSIETQEFFIVVFLDRANNILGYYKQSMGGTAGTIIDQKLILGTALKALAHGIILSHNHPSGSTRPSDADRSITQKLKESARSMDISVLDHLIITKRNGYYSFADEGIMGIPKSKKLTFDNVIG